MNDRPDPYRSSAAAPPPPATLVHRIATTIFALTRDVQAALALATFLAGALVLLLVGMSQCACTPGASSSAGSAYDKAAPIAKVACTVLTATTADDVVHSACATLDEVDAIVQAIRSARADAGAPGRTTSACQIVPTTAFCATAAELAPQIDRLAASRRDGGAP